MTTTEVSSLSKLVQIAGKTVILRLYNPEIDDKRLIATLFTKMNNEEGLKELHDGDKKYFINSNKNFRLVAESDNELIATITLMNEEQFKINSRLTMFSVVTKEEYRGSGLSSKLFDFACFWAKEMGESEVIVNTDKWNVRSQKFYEKMGCSLIQETEEQFIYEKNLQNLSA